MSDNWVSVRQQGPWARAGTDPTPEEAKIVADVQAVALEYAAGTMPLEVALTATTMRHRFVARQFTEVGSERWMALMKLVNDAVLSTGAWFSPQGIVTREMLNEGHARMVHEDGKEVCLFAAGFGSDGRPWYRKPEQRGPNMFRQNHQGVSDFGAAAVDDQAEVPWYDRIEESER